MTITAPGMSLVSRKNDRSEVIQFSVIQLGQRLTESGVKGRGGYLSYPINNIKYTITVKSSTQLITFVFFEPSFFYSLMKHSHESLS